jgi:hypothetical protein
MNHLFALRIVILEIGPDGAPPVEIPEHLEAAAVLLVEASPQRAAHVLGELASQILHHPTDDSAGDLQNRPLHHSLERQHGPEQLVARFEPVQDLGICDQFGHSVAIERVPLNHLGRFAREELADFPDPFRHRKHTGLVASLARFKFFPRRPTWIIARPPDAAPAVFAAVEVIQRTVHSRAT